MINSSLRYRTMTAVASIMLMSGIFTSHTQGQVTIAITSPADRAVIRPGQLTSITGTVSGAGFGPNVRIAISKHETDIEWAKDARGTYRWLSGPTGQWLGTVGFRGTRWTAPSSGWTLPSGSNLPNGKYVITAIIQNQRGGRQFTSTFTVRRTLEDLVQSDVIRPR